MARRVATKALKQQLSREGVAGVLLILPFTIGFLLFMIVPMGVPLYHLFCDYNILPSPVFIGMKNFISMFRDETFFKTLKVMFFFVFASVSLEFLFALIVTMLLLGNSEVSGFYRVVYRLPSIIGGSVAVSVLWKKMFTMDGVMNKLLRLVGIETNFFWLGDTRTAIWALIPLVVWQLSSPMLTFLSFLKQVPQSLYGAADVDGASGPAKSFKITPPLLTPTIFLNLVMQMTNGFLAFTQCYAIAQGKPMNSALLHTVYMYKQFFESYNTGYGAAPVWVMLVVIGLITLLLSATKRFRVYERGP